MVVQDRPWGLREARHSAYLATVVAFLVVGCASAPRPTLPTTVQSVPGGQTAPVESKAAVGIASFYGQKYQGRRTASGEVYDMRKMTAAHRSLPFGVNVRVTDLSNNRAVIVRINDRGPFVRNRIIDLSLAAARQLGIVQHGSAQVRLEILSERTDRAGLDLR